MVLMAINLLVDVLTLNTFPEAPSPISLINSDPNKISVKENYKLWLK